VIKEPNLLAAAGHDVMDAFQSYAKHDMRGVMTAGMGLFQMATRDTDAITAKARATRTSPADVVRTLFPIQAPLSFLDIVFNRYLGVAARIHRPVRIL
jgi:hypothetical protein